MNYSQFFNMLPEVSLMIILVLAFVCDFCSVGKERKWFHPLMVVLMALHTLGGFYTLDSTDAFGGMYQATPTIGLVKILLSFGTLIVIIQAHTWLRRIDTAFKEGEFYMLIVSTLLGMNMMLSAGHFLLFFIGLEMASVPVACLVAFDKYRHNSAEAGAKFILSAIFSSGIMLYGLSFIYAQTGTLYFDDMASKLSVNPMSILGLVFFFSGLGFKISLVPFHFWTADTYQGAPTTVTGYLSVVSKGAATFTLLTILTKVFAPMVTYWEVLLYIVIVLSITIANLFAIRQTELKRFMAYSSISQAGYIMLAVVAASSLGTAALIYYILIYIVANLAVFTIIGVIEENNGGKTEMSDYNALYTTNPKLSLLMTLALFSLGGIPPFAGMFSKFFAFMAAAEKGSVVAYVVLFIALINTVISLYYYLLIVKAMYIKKNDTPLPTFKSDCNTRLALALCTFGVVAFGVLSCIYDWIVSLV